MHIKVFSGEIYVYYRRYWLNNNNNNNLLNLSCISTFVQYFYLRPAAFMYLTLLPLLDFFLTLMVAGRTS